MLSRRGILGSIICAPAIIRVAPLMRIKPMVTPITATEIVDRHAAFLKSFSQQVYARYMSYPMVSRLEDGRIAFTEKRVDTFTGEVTYR